MYQLKITVDEITPAIWRIIRLPESCSLNKLHHIIQVAFDWTNAHLYMVGDYENKIGDPILWEDGETPTMSAKKVKIEDELKKVWNELKYEYDMGDGWQRSSVMEKIEYGVLL